MGRNTFEYNSEDVRKEPDESDSRKLVPIPPFLGLACLVHRVTNLLEPVNHAEPMLGTI